MNALYDTLQKVKDGTLSVEEAALQLNRIFQAADQAAQDYIASAKAQSEALLAKTKAECEAMLAEARAKCNDSASLSDEEASV